MHRFGWLQRESDMPMDESHDVKSHSPDILLHAANLCDGSGLRNRATIKCKSDVCTTHGCPAVKDVLLSHPRSSVSESDLIHTCYPQMDASTLIWQTVMLRKGQPRFVGSPDLRTTITVHSHSQHFQPLEPGCNCHSSSTKSQPRNVSTQSLVRAPQEWTSRGRSSHRS